MEKYVRLDEYCSAVKDGTHDTPTPTIAGKYLVTSRAVKDNRIDFSNCYFISQKDFDKINKRSLVEQWDVIMTMIGTVGRLLVVKDKPDYAIKNMALFKVGEEWRAKWLYYYLSSKEIQKYFELIANGTSQHFVGLGQLRKFKVLNFTPKAKRIASILSAYDSLIELNTRRIRLLEQMAEHLYREWFVRFRFPHHENTPIVDGLPQGWEKGYLKDICEFKRGKNITSEQMQTGNISVISAGIAPSGFHNKANVTGESITMSSSGANAGFISMHYTDIWAADCSYVDTQCTQYIYFAYEFLNNLRSVITNFQRGAAQPHVYPSDINHIKLYVPAASVMAMANEHFKAIHQGISLLQRQSSLLVRQRDLLLPRLLGGKIEVGRMYAD